MDPCDKIRRLPSGRGWHQLSKTKKCRKLHGLHYPPKAPWVTLPTESSMGYTTHRKLHGLHYPPKAPWVTLPTESSMGYTTHRKLHGLHHPPKATWSTLPTTKFHSLATVTLLLTNRIWCPCSHSSEYAQGMLRSEICLFVC